MEASVFTPVEHDEQGERDVWSDLETLKKLYGLLDKTAGTNTESNNEESLDHKSKVYLMKLLDEATQNTLTFQMKSPLSTHLASTSSFQRLNQSYNEGPDQNLNNSLIYSFQRRDSKLFNSQFSIKSRQSQVHCTPTYEQSNPIHPMSRYQGRSGIDRSSKHVIGGSSMYQCPKDKLIYCPSEHNSRSSAHKTATEMTPKQSSVSPKHGTNLIPNQVRLDRMSSRVKSKKQYRETTKDCCSDGTTSSSSRESTNRMLDQQRRIGKFDKTIQHHKRLPATNRKKKLRDNLSVDSGSNSHSVSSSATSRSSSSASKGGLGSLPIIPFHKPGPLPVVLFQKSGRFPIIARSRKPVISQHEHNKSLRRIRSTSHHKSVSPRRNPKELAKDNKSEQNKGRFKRLKDKLAVVFHHRHDHHHYHHHRTSEDGSTKGQIARTNKDHHRRSLWKYLKKIVHHSSEQTADHIVPSQHHHHRHLSALFRMLFGHFWGNKRRKKTRLGRTATRVRVKKLRWWHKLGRARHMKLTNGKKVRLRLRYGAKGGIDEERQQKMIVILNAKNSEKIRLSENISN